MTTPILQTPADRTGSTENSRHGDGVAAFTASAHRSGPRLLADIGGTNARFALEFVRGEAVCVHVLPCAQYPGPAEAIRAYLQLVAAQLQGHVLQHAALAIANPVDGDQVRMTNHHWEFSIAALKAQMQWQTLLVVNDFTALARALPHLRPQQLQQVGGGQARPGGVLGLIGAGTGLGVSGMVPAGERWIALQSEGGHVTFAPSDEREIDILRFAWREFPHVSAERLLSGIGLELMYRALLARAGKEGPALTAPEISRRALSGECAICDETIDVFCAALGTVAGNIAITLGTQGGLYIGGGIVPRLGERFLRSAFRSRFEHKGRFANYLAQVPTFIITAQYPAFLGVSAMLDEVLVA